MNLLRLSMLIDRPTESSYVVPISQLSPHEQQRRTSNVTPQTFARHLDECGEVSYVLGTWLLKLCISRGRMDLLDVVIARRSSMTLAVLTPQIPKRHVRIDESKNVVHDIENCLTNEIEHNNIALQNAQRFAQMFLASRLHPP